MTSVFDETGRNVACTVVEAGPCVVTQVKTESSDGYSALQLGFGDAKEKNTSQPLQGHFKKAGIDPKRRLVEFRDATLEKKAGETITVDEIFVEGDIINAIGTSKGKGFQGVMKRYNFGGQPDSHGHMMHRRPGAIGAGTWPGRVWKNQKMPGRHGTYNRTVQNLKVLQVRKEDNALLVTGAVPGHKGSYVVIRPAKKKPAPTA